MSTENIKRNFEQLILYGIIGCLSATVDFVFYNVLAICIGLHYIIANSISVLIGILTSFSLNRTFNFKVKDKIVVRFSLFFTCGMLGLFLINAILWLGIDNYHFSEIGTKIVSIFIVALLQFIFNKFITFKQTK